MGKRKVFGTLIRRTEGSVAIISAISLVAFLGMVSLVIDMGHLYTVRNELQNVTDAAALAAANVLIKDSGGVAERDAAGSKQAALDVVQTQSKVSNQEVVEDTDRNDLTILFGTWNINAGDPSTAWAEIGSTCASDSNANAIKITISRASGTVYGPVSNLFGGILGFNTSQVATTAIAYLGYTNEVQTGAIQVPLALPSTGQSSPLVSNGRAGWFARLFGPNEALANTPTTKTIKFRDTGGANVTVNAQKKLDTTDAEADENQGYFYKTASTDSIPNAINYPIRKIYTPSLTGASNYPVLVRHLKVGDQIWPGSEYRYPSSMTEMFNYLKSAYNAKKDASGNWPTTLVVHGKQTASLPGKAGFLSLARLLTLFSPTQAFACVSIQPPTLSVHGVVNVVITAVTSGTGNDGSSYTYPKKIKDTYTGNKNVTYADQKDFLDRYPNSTWNVNTVTIQTATDESTVSPPGSQSGGPSNSGITPGATADTGAFASCAVLVK